MSSCGALHVAAHACTERVPLLQAFSNRLVLPATPNTLTPLPHHSRPPPPRLCSWHSSHARWRLTRHTHALDGTVWTVLPASLNCTPCDGLNPHLTPGAEQRHTTLAATILMPFQRTLEPSFIALGARCLTRLAPPRVRHRVSSTAHCAGGTT